MKIALMYKAILITMTLLFSVPQSYAQQCPKEKEILPQQFINIKEAKKYNCTIVNLKGRNHKNCVLKKFADHELKLTIYDADSEGRFLKSQELCIPSWYWKATVKYRDLLGNGKQFMIITFEGNRGTGTLQMIQMFIAWHNGNFVPVFAETIDYGLTEGFYYTSLKMKYSIKNKASSKVTLLLNYSFAAKEISSFPDKSTANWWETLEWNEETFSFYNVEEENNKNWNDPNNFLPSKIQRNISKVRLSIKDVDVNNLCESFFDKTKIMSILNSE